MLADVIDVLSHALDAQSLSQRAVELVGRASRADGAYVYLWDGTVERFVLRAATEGSEQRLVNQLMLRPGEGLTGWSALMRRSARIDDDLLDDPRFLHIPATAEDQWRSALAVPIVLPDSETVGVFTLYSRQPGYFDDQLAEALEEVAKLLSSGLDRAAQLEVRSRQSRALEALVQLAESPPRSKESSLAAIADQAQAIVPCTVAVAELAAASDPRVDVVGVRLAAVVLDPFAAGLPEAGTADGETVKRSLRAWEPRLTTLSQPIRVGGRLVGTVSCHRPHRFSDDDRLLLEAVANYAALVLAGTTHPGSSSLDELIRCRVSSRAEDILIQHGWVPKSLVTPFVVSIDPGQELPGHEAVAAATRIVEASLKARDRRLVPDAPGRAAGLVLGALVDAEEQAHLHEELQDRLAGHGLSTRLAIGWGGPSAAAAGIVEGLRAAADAATWAGAAAGTSMGLSHKHVPLLRSVSQVAGERREELERIQADLRAIDEYDRENGSSLLATLRVHLECNGSASEASRRLFVHRNTLRQRLERLERMLSMPLTTADSWFITQLALLAHDAEEAPDHPGRSGLSHPRNGRSAGG